MKIINAFNHLVYAIEVASGKLKFWLMDISLLGAMMLFVIKAGVPCARHLMGYAHAEYEFAAWVNATAILALLQFFVAWMIMHPITLKAREYREWYNIPKQLEFKF